MIITKYYLAPLQSISPEFIEIYFKIIRSQTVKFPMWFISVSLKPKCCILCFTHTCHIPRSSELPYLN
jgi:hypothetical protein